MYKKLLRGARWSEPTAKLTASQVYSVIQKKMLAGDQLKKAARMTLERGFTFQLPAATGFEFFMFSEIATWSQGFASFARRKER